jgi:putative FmdB family regulatory protein
MPLYEYECFLCGHRFERIQRVSDAPLTECPACGGSVRRLLGVPALQFKGSGFYVTDYAKKESGASQPDTKEAAATGSGAGKESPAKEKSEAKTSSAKSEDP